MDGALSKRGNKQAMGRRISREISRAISRRISREISRAINRAISRASSRLIIGGTMGRTPRKDLSGKSPDPCRLIIRGMRNRPRRGNK